MKVKRGKLFIVGIGPGSLDEMTYHARRAIEAANVIVGYSAYVDLAEPLFTGKVVITGGMGMEVERCEAALREALLGRTVALISSGDAGIYGMAGLVLEIAHKKGIEHPEAIEIVPGVPAFVAAAALAGAPLMNDFACISLSDLMNPWEKIEKRLSAAASGDFVTCLYNPRSKKRTGQIKKARDIFLKHRSADIPCAVLRNIARDGQKVELTTLEKLLKHEIDMLSLVIIGNSETEKLGDWMVTKRGYFQ
jgi:precorrin-3B C17-methyltransferase